MNYLDLIRNSSINHKPLFMTCATTGIGNDDELIGVWVSEESGSARGLCCSGISEEHLDKAFEFHKITKQIYDSTPQKPPEDFLKAVTTLVNTASVFTYNPQFIRKMLDRMCCGGSVNLVYGLYDLAKIHMWVSSGQIFTAEEQHTVDNIMFYVNSWTRRPSGMMKIIQQVYPDWYPDPAKIVPEGMLEGLQAYLRFLETQTVRVAQPFSV